MNAALFGRPSATRQKRCTIGAPFTTLTLKLANMPGKHEKLGLLPQAELEPFGPCVGL